jgi:hypothetical protein
MTVAEASRAAGRPLIVHEECGTGYLEGFEELGFLLDGGGRILTIRAGEGIHTISGAHVGITESELLRIYPAARAETGPYSSPVMRITSAMGATVDFYLRGDDHTVTGILVAANEDDARALGSCD